jgi:Holliday junction resolvase
MKEGDLQRLIMVSLSENGCMVFRNNTGSYKSDSGVFIRYGLCVGSADIIGIHKPTGRFLAFEVKTAKGKPTKEQLNFIEQVRAANGVAGIVRSTQDALDLLPR